MKRQRHWTYSEEKTRKRVLVRDNYTCQLVLPGCQGTATTVDHIHPKAWGGTAHESNLQAACKPCNQSKGARSVSSSFFRGAGHSTRPLRKIPPRAAGTSPWAVEPRDLSRESPE